ncbi:ectoine hydroxylase [Speluncibacter jeojiensis]|uniref:Ectoine hydroxylase n=1 Tax=Speluncibacter jeojiensis TaxID=2710754 RepID=A0A9X4RC43_9ACTN|nr:ectoine hydroxylase [Corynebacteriales bacterium D3-21]
MTVDQTMEVADSAVTDRYPTRMGESPRWVRRTDPTVWAGNDGPMTVPELRAHDRAGYTVVPEAFAAEEILRLRAEVSRLADDPALRGDERVVRERGTGAVRSIFEVHRVSPVIAGLVADDRIVGRARQLLGSDVYIHQSRVNLMPGFEGTGFYWHSDFETWHAEDGLPRPRAVSCSIALTDNLPYNGALMVLPGSHRTFVPCVGHTPEQNYRTSLVQQQVGVPSRRDVEALVAEHGIEQFTGSAGSALWFDSNIMHGSGSNVTPHPRSNIFLVFNSVDNAPGEPFAAGAPRPEFIAARTAEPVR